MNEEKFALFARFSFHKLFSRLLSPFLADFIHVNGVFVLNILMAYTN